MPRFCGACGERKDETGHDRGEAQPVIDPVTGRTTKRRPWVCRLRKIARTFGTNLETGERKVTSTYVPETLQRTSKNHAALVPVRLLEARSRAGVTQ